MLINPLWYLKWFMAGFFADMKLKNYHSRILFIGVIFLSACTTQTKKETSQTVIKGNIQNSKTGKVYFYSYADSIDLFIERFTALDSSLIDADGNFSFELEINQPKVFSLRYGSRDLVSNLFISPGDQLEFKFYGNKFIPIIEPIGEEAKFNIYLLQFSDTFYKEPVRAKEYYIASNYYSADQYAVYNDQRKKQMLVFFNNYFRNDNISKNHRSYALFTIQYELASDQLMYLWKKRMKGEPYTADSSYYNFKNPNFVENADAFISPSYIRFLNLYLNEDYEKNISNGKTLTSSQNFHPSAEKYVLAHQLFNGIFLEAILYRIFYNDVKDVTDTEITERIISSNIDSLKSEFEIKYQLEEFKFNQKAP